LFYVSILTFLKGASPRSVVAEDPGLIDALAGALASRVAEPGMSWAVLVAIVVITWGACVWRFSRAEITPKEEGD
jgi:ABC-type transport system involved in multi-copper enzyme maturation permease subunit